MARGKTVLQKHIYFNGQKLTLFSLDGVTWSSRKAELPQIKERHEALKDKIRSNFVEPAETIEAESPEGDKEKVEKKKVAKHSKPTPKSRVSQSPKKKTASKTKKKVA